MKLFTLVADLTLDTGQFTTAIGNAKSAAQGFDTTVATSKAIALGNALYDVSKQAIEMAINLGKAIYGEYADTEQLLGGVETIFGNDAQVVIDNANKAFMTAGMSANDYMDTVIGFSTRLLQGLEGDTMQAAYYADLALTDMADNVNKFGSSMTMVQNAYQGFSKGNFTMLDNLRLGYGGTQEEMVRLINDSGVAVGMFTDEAGQVRDMMLDDLNSFPLFKMFEAIHTIQENLGVTGTTAKEASDTLTGSGSAFEAALGNMVAGLANADADIAVLRQNLIDTGTTMVENYVSLLPVIVKNALAAITGMTEGAGAVLDDIGEDYSAAWVEVETTSSQVLALIDALTAMESSGEDAVGTDMWNTLLAELQQTLPEIGSLIDAETGKITGGTEALRAYVEEWKTTSMELARQQYVQDMYDAYAQMEAEIAKLQMEQQVADIRQAGAEESMDALGLQLYEYVLAGAAKAGAYDLLKIWDAQEAENTLLRVAEGGTVPMEGSELMKSLVAAGYSSEHLEQMANLYAGYLKTYKEYDIDNSEAIAERQALLENQQEEINILQQILAQLTANGATSVNVTVTNTADTDVIATKVEQHIMSNFSEAAFGL